jgi:phosphoenolpyruvate carboxykinase (ATP)
MLKLPLAKMPEPHNRIPATADKQTQRYSLLFGWSGTGKTTLSADHKRYLIGDDEHCWGEDGVFNIEGGCYAKAINLTSESERDIFAALRFGAVLEKVVLEEDHTVDYTDTSITENTRGAYPINFIGNSLIPCMAGHPTDVIFLTCDAFGVLPAVALNCHTPARSSTRSTTALWQRQPRRLIPFWG